MCGLRDASASKKGGGFVQIVLIKQGCTSILSNKGVGQSCDVAPLVFPREPFNLNFH